MSSVSPSGHHGLAQRDGLGPLPLMDFTYNETEAHFAIVFGAFLTLIATISVIARVYSRYFVANHVGLDDFMAVGALVCRETGVKLSLQVLYLSLTRWISSRQSR